MSILKLNIEEIGPFDKLELDLTPFNPDRNVTILTGPNGSGKSTILYALASSFSHNSNVILQRAHAESNIVPRVDVIMDSGETRTWLAARGAVAHQISNPFASSDVDLLQQNQYARIYATRKNGQDYINTSNQLRSDTMRSSPPFDWAIFAYSGQRAMPSNFAVQIGETIITALQDSASFLENQVSNKNFIQWIANNLTKRAIFKSQGDSGKLRRVDKTIQALENALSKVTGKEIVFDLKTDPFSVSLVVDKVNVEYFVLPAGLQSVVAWLGDLLMRLEYVPWESDLAIVDRKFTLLLDEIEVHLHPNWQKKILPVITETFPNAQIVVSTHSPFVVGSVEDAKVIDLGLDPKGRPIIQGVLKSDPSMSYQRIFREIFDLEGQFGVEIESDVRLFRDLLSSLRDSNQRPVDIDRLLKVARKLAVKNDELKQIVSLELKQTEKNLSIELKL